jgi:hypothetical protein
MADPQTRVATELFSSSSHQSLQNPVFRTAGNDMHTYNFNFGPSGEPSGFWQNWGRVLRQVSEYFQSPEDRDVLRLPSPEIAAGSMGAIGAQYSIENTRSQQGLAESNEVAGEQPQDYYDVVRISPLKLAQ